MRPRVATRRQVLALLTMSFARLPAAYADPALREIERIGTEVTSVGVKLKTLAEQFGDVQVTQSKRRYADRYANAEILFLLGDYQRASLVLLELVAELESKAQASYPNVVYYLAEAQFQMGNDIAARRYFEALVELRHAPYLQDAIRRLIQIADRNQRWEGLDERVSVLRQRGALPPSIAYINAKSLLRQSKLAAVEAATADIPAKHPLWAKGRYLAAVAVLAGGDLESARQRFEQLLAIPDSYESAAELRELAAMNRARLYMEAGDIPHGLDAYQAVSRHSPRFDESLYEVTWGYVRAAAAASDEATRSAEFGKALKSLEILLLSEAETTLAPEARLLLGSVFLRLRRHDEAEAAFRDVVQRYQPVREELQRLTAKVTDPVTYYEEMAGRSRQGGGLLPPLALKWAAEEQQLKGALEVVSDLDEGDGWIEEASQIIDKLLAVLASEERATFFPALQQAQLHRLELVNSLVGLSSRLLAVERELVSQHLDAPKQAELRAVLAERLALEPEYQKLPQNREDYTARRDSRQKELEEQEKQVYRLKWAIEEQQRALASVGQFLDDNPETLSKSERRELRERMVLQEKEITALEELQKELEAQIDRDRSTLGATAQGGTRDDEVRTRYGATLEREREILQQGRAGLPVEAQQLLARLESERERVNTFFAELQNFRDRLTRLVAKQAAEIRAQLADERAQLETFRAARDRVRGDAKRVIGEIAIASLGDVERKFHDIVLRGDVGVIDVAWALKESKTHAVSRWVDEQRRELQVLDNEFSEVLGE